MTDPKEISQLIQTTVSEVLDDRLGALKDEIVRRVAESIAPALAEMAEAGKPVPHYGPR